MSDKSDNLQINEYKTSSFRLAQILYSAVYFNVCPDEMLEVATYWCNRKNSKEIGLNEVAMAILFAKRRAKYGYLCPGCAALEEEIMPVFIEDIKKIIEDGSKNEPVGIYA